MCLAYWPSFSIRECSLQCCRNPCTLGVELHNVVYSTDVQCEECILQLQEACLSILSHQVAAWLFESSGLCPHSPCESIIPRPSLG